MSGRQAGRPRGLKWQPRLRLGIFAAAVVLLGVIIGGQARRQEPRAVRPQTSTAPSGAFAPQVRRGGDRAVAGPVTTNEVERALRPESPFKRKVAALTRAYETRDDAFSQVLLNAGVDPHLRLFAVRFLTKRARFDRHARHLLGEFAASGAGMEDRRFEAAVTVLRWSDDAELDRWSGKLHLERDPGRMELAIRALADNDAEAARALIVGLAWNHPDPEVRHRAEEERSGLFCPDHAPGAGEE